MDADPFPILSVFLSNFWVYQPDWFIILGLLGLIMLIFSSALISGSEIAFFSFDPPDIDELEQENSNRAKRILKLVRAPRILLATILIANNFINITIIIFSDIFIRYILPEATLNNWAEFIKAMIPMSFTTYSVGQLISFLITVVGVTFVLVLMGEVTPKVLAYANYKKFAFTMSPVLSVLTKLFAPFSRGLVNWGHFIERRLQNKSIGDDVTKEEIDKAIDLTAIDENSSKDEIGLLKSIVKFGDVAVNDIMQPRIDIAAIDMASDYEAMLSSVKETGFSRLPVFDGDLDQIKGIMYIKDLIGHFHDDKDFHWQQVIREDVLYVPETKLISELLKEFQKKRMHMAIVIDEYGATEGLVTLEDIMEEVVGEIQDEFDDDKEVDYRKINDHTYVFDGKTLVSDFCKIVGLPLDVFDAVRVESDSLAGLILEKTQDFPKKGTEVYIRNFRFKVMNMGKRRIRDIRIILPHGTEDENIPSGV